MADSDPPTGAPDNTGPTLHDTARDLRKLARACDAHHDLELTEQATWLRTLSAELTQLERDIDRALEAIRTSTQPATSRPTLRQALSGNFPTPQAAAP